MDIDFIGLREIAREWERNVVDTEMFEIQNIYIKKNEIQTDKDEITDNTEHTDEVTKTTQSSLILNVIKYKVQINKSEKKKREDVMKIYIGSKIYKIK